MRSELTIYHPTVWRTCRALMNERRLACLAVVLKTPGLSVGEIAVESGVPENQASMNLRTLQARGLMVARRQGVHIRYFAEPDPLVEHAATVLDAVCRELKGGSGHEAEKLLVTLRAFTHSRRLTILKCLMLQNETACETVASRTRISQPSVWRHLGTLRNAGLACETTDGTWQLVAKEGLPAFAQTLLAVISNGGYVDSVLMRSESTPTQPRRNG
jgi:DNA-binding transcriptional ArsR family regulator